MDAEFLPTSPRPQDMPDRVSIVAFESGTYEDPESSWRLAGGGRTWTMPEHLQHVDHLVAWLHLNGYEPLLGTASTYVLRDYGRAHAREGKDASQTDPPAAAPAPQSKPKGRRK